MILPQGRLSAQAGHSFHQIQPSQITTERESEFDSFLLSGKQLAYTGKGSKRRTAKETARQQLDPSIRPVVHDGPVRLPAIPSQTPAVQIPHALVAPASPFEIAPAQPRLPSPPPTTLIVPEQPPLPLPPPASMVAPMEPFFRIAQGETNQEDSRDSSDADNPALQSDPPQIPDTVIRPPTNRNTTNQSQQDTPAPFPIEAQSLGGDTSTPTSNFPNQPLPESNVVTAARSQQSSRTVGSSITVISAEAIRNSGQTEVADVLRNVVGADVTRSGGFGQLTTVFLRGSNGNHTKVLLDGMPINDPGSAGRAFDFSFLSVDSIQRIEVLRGPQSTLYGSDAIGGVINIITNHGEGPPSSRVSVSSGSYQTFHTSGSVSGGDDRIYYDVGTSYFDTEGFSASNRGPNNSEDDGYENRTVSGRIGMNVKSCLNLDLVFRHYDTTTEIDSINFLAVPSVPQDSDSFITQENTFLRGLATLSLCDDIWVQRFGAGYVQYDRFSFDPFGGPFYGRQQRVDWTNDINLYNNRSTAVVLSGGGDYTEEIGRNNTIGDVRQDDLGGFVNLRGTFCDVIHLSTGMRWDDYTFAGSAFTHRSTGRINLTPVIAAHGAIGTGFRAPALAELFDPFVGNANLQSETSKGWEAGMEVRSADHQTILDVTYFRNDFVNLIQFDFGTFLLENVGRALASGVETTYTCRLDRRNNIFFNHTFNDTLNRDTGFGLLRRPRNKVSMGWNRLCCNDRANVTCAVRIIGDRVDTQNFINPSYWRVDLSGTYRINRNWRGFARVDNLFDEEYEEVLGFAATDLAAYIGLELMLGG